MTIKSTIPDLIESPASKPRVFRTQLPAELFLQLEAQALKRGVHSFKLAEFVITAWLRGELVSRPPAAQASPSPLSPSPSVAGLTQAGPGAGQGGDPQRGEVSLTGARAGLSPESDRGR